MVRNIKETFLPKTEMREKQFVQDPGYVEDVKDAWCMSYAKLHWVYLFLVKDIEDVYNVYKLQCRF